jgi:hypothetical protein
MNFENLSRNSYHGSSNREFGLMFSAFFMILAALDKSDKLPFSLDVSNLKNCVFLQYMGLMDNPLTLVFTSLSLVFLLSALLMPNALMPLNWLWIKLGLLIHTIVSPVILGLLFYLVFTPVGLVMRLFGNDLLRLRLDESSPTYWIDRTYLESDSDSLENQF